MRNFLVVLCIALAVVVVVTGCKSKEDRAKEAVQAMLEELKKGEVDKFIEYLDEESLSDYLPKDVRESMSDDGLKDAREKIKRKVKEVVKEAYPKDLSYEILSATAEGDEGDTVTVVTKINMPEGEEKTISFIIKKGKGGWKADLNAMVELEKPDVKKEE